MAYFSFDQMGLNIARGLVKDLSGINKFGFSNTINSTWDYVSVGSIHFPDTALPVSVVSDSDSDKPTGLGAWTVEVQGLDAAGLHQVENVTLDGLTPVSTVNPFLRVYRMSVDTASSDSGGIGMITASIDGNEVSRIDPAYDNQTLQAVFTVPSDKTGYITSMTISAAKDNAAIMAGLFIRSPGVNKVFKVKQLVDIYRDTTTIEFRTPIKVESLSDIAIKSRSDNSNVEVCGTFNMVMETNRT